MRILFLFFLLCSPAVIGQELPPVLNFDPNDYRAGNQNWMVSKAEDGNVYIANSMGLLEYNGAEWNLYPVPNNTVVRAVRAVDERIYTGAYMEAGYWRKNPCGLLEYTSLLPLFPEGIHDGEQFWRIESMGENIIFQSFEGIYLFNRDSGTITVLDIPGNRSVSNLFKVGGDVYFMIPEDGIYILEQGTARLEIPAEILENREVVHLSREQQGLEMITRSGEFLRWDGENLREVRSRLEEAVRGISVFSALKLRDGSFLLGSVENGLYHIGPEGELRQHFNQEHGLQNNTVLSLFLDKEDNVWAGLDNGLSTLNLNSPFRIFEDQVGRIGTVYTSFRNEDYLYLGTNQGLYYRRNGEEAFRFMSGTNGQVWSLQLLEGNLFGGHNNGTFLITGDEAVRIAERQGTWTIIDYEARDGVYVQGHYNGFSLLEKNGDSFRDLGMVNNFPHSSKYIVSGEDGYIWIGNEHKGVFRIRLDEALNSIAEVNNYTFPDSPGITSSIFKFNDSLYYTTITDIFLYEPRQDSFTENNQLARAFGDVERISGRMVAEGDKVWAFGSRAIISAGTSKLEKGYSINQVYLPREHRTIPLGYENVSELQDNSYLLGLVDGYLLFDEGFRDLDPQYEVGINKITTARLDEEFKAVALNKEHSLDYEFNNIRFHFSIPEYKKFLVPLYSYRLNGFSERWSEWNRGTVASFENLPSGTYEFELRGKVGDDITEEAGYTFSIGRPWYFSNAAIAGYVLLFLLLSYLIHRVYVMEHRKRIRENEKALKMKNLEAEQKIIKLQNEQLERDMANKNKELAVSTMSLVKKNEFLTSIKQKLQGTENSTAVKSVLRTIDKDINEEDNWKFFKEAFNNADKDFFRKIKARHPELTSNDLKLCAYLRLNLTSKEIAPLLNISVKSVEIKRYRLRKKMDLSRETNLVDYILEI